jgi:hypothetical protein
MATDLMNNPPNPDPYIAWQVVLTLGVIVAIVTNIWTAVRGNKAQKREVSFQFTPASKEEFDQFTATTNTNFVQVRDEMKRDREANQVHASRRSETLFAKMENTRTELDAKLEHTRRELSEKIDDMPERVIATLKNTGAI